MSTKKSASTAEQPGKVVRQDRHEIHDLRCFLVIGDKSYQVINYSHFGLAIQAEAKMAEDSCVHGHLMIEDVKVCDVELRVVRNESTSSGSRVAFEVTQGHITTERLGVIAESLRLVNETSSLRKRNSKLPENFRLRVYEIKDALATYERQIKAFEAQRQFLSIQDRVDFESAVIDAVAAPMHEIFSNCNLELGKIMKDQPKESVEAGFEFCREQLKELVFQSPFADRSFKKPLGYAGDFEMMNLIYRNEDFGLSLFGRCMERVMQLHGEPGGVRNRAEFLGEKIKETLESTQGRPCRMISIASGPAFELRKLVEHLSDDDCKRTEFFLLDQDFTSLKSAQKSILSRAKELGRSIKLTLIHRPIRQVIAEGLGAESFDLVYSAGLFDYFDDSVARRAAEILFENLVPGGRLVIGNFATTSPNFFGMLAIFDWYLILRSPQDLERLFAFNGSKLVVESEENGINLFAVISKEK